MGRLTVFLVGCGAVLAPVLAGMAGCGRADRPRPSVTELDATIPATSTSQLALGPELRVSCSLFRRDRRVNLRWRHAAGGAFPAGADALTVQALWVDMTPLVAEFAPPDGLLVAGLTDDDRVVVEHWTLAPPEVVALASGKLALTPHPLAAKRVVFAAPRAERGLVCMLVANRGAPGRSFVRFTVDDDLLELDWSAAQPRPLSVALAADDEPALCDRRYRTLSGGAQREAGFVYKLLYEPVPPDGAPLVLIDSDRDGRLDRHAAMDAKQMASEGLLDAARFEELDGVSVE